MVRWSHGGYIPMSKIKSFYWEQIAEEDEEQTQEEENGRN